MACGGMIFIDKISNFTKNFSFYFILFFHVAYYCSINAERQSEKSGLRPDTISRVYSFS